MSYFLGVFHYNVGVYYNSFGILVEVKMVMWSNGIGFVIVKDGLRFYVRLMTVL
jgi:hypothetical protein